MLTNQVGRTITQLIKAKLTFAKGGMAGDSLVDVDCC